MVKNHRVRSHTNILVPVEHMWGSFQGWVGPLSYLGTVLEIGPTARGLGVGANCCITTELIYLWSAN